MAAGPASGMEDGGSRTVEILITMESGTIADVNVFKISEETVIEQTNLVKYTAAVKCSSGTGREYPGGMQIAECLTHTSAADGVTTDGIPVSGTINMGRRLGTEHTAADGEDRRRLPDSVIHMQQEIPVQDCIRIQQQNVWRSTSADSDIHCMGESGIFRQRDDGYSREMFPDIQKAVVGGTVIDKENVEITKRLPHKRRQTLCKKMCSVIIRDDNCYFRHM